ncbi:MAG: GTP cyclohydrolase FolE2 [Desulfobacterota bacterium]|jgi:GTP cyclohydrolase I|nr:GTP cyclohydrolase FolE2 [Thermodesulfobacteriota bacterium]
MIDVQSQKDDRRIEIDKVGVKNIRYPITVRDKANGTQQTVASINMYVNLPHDHKGTHMSRFIEVLSEHRRQITLENFSKILEELKTRLNAESAHMEITFPYFITKTAPVSQAEGLMEYVCTFKGSANRSKGRDLLVELRIPITTVCPCSKEISSHGAHNQRGEVRVGIRFKKFVWIEDLIRLVEESSSCEVFSVLKRNDEKYVTEKGYDNPMFVEDVVREIARKLEADPNITWFSVDSENFESIHNHSAYAYIERQKSREA